MKFIKGFGLRYLCTNLLCGVFFFCISQSNLAAQGSYRIGLISGLNIGQKLSNNWKINYAAESRIIATEAYFHQPEPLDFQYALTDVSVVVSKKIRTSNKAALGYLLRIKPDGFDHRFIQQYAMITPSNGLRLAHRFVADQTFEQAKQMKWRLRYRFSAQFALNGEKVDAKELYLKLSNEYLNIMQGKTYDLEVRLVPFLGYALSEKSKIEWGFDYRINNFLDATPKNSMWAVVKCYLSV